MSPLASKATGTILDQFIEDDADKMVAIIQDVFTTLAEEYLSTQKEAEVIADSLKSQLTGSFLKDMFACPDRKAYACIFLEEHFKDMAFNRKFIELPSEEQIQEGLKLVLEDIAEEEALS